MDISKALMIAIIVLALALIIFLIVKDKKVEAPSEIPVDENHSETVNPSSEDAVIPVPAESSWMPKTVENEITFDAPSDYFISYPVIGECDDVISISTATATDPTIAVALIYKEGCVKDTDVTEFYAHRQVKDGYVFQTNSTHPTVLAVFDRIVASAEVE